jgi:DNA-binding transcriptional MerR regulator
MNAFTIKDLENLSGIKAHTIRIWEQRYDFIKPQRSNTNIRYYTSEELKTVLNVALLNKHGYKVSQIDKMDSEELQETVLKLDKPNAQEDRIINSLTQNMVSFDGLSFENNLDTYIKNNGIEKSVEQIIFPFLNRVGILWSTNQIIPAQEHLISNIIRQKVIVAINELDTVLESKKSCALFLPEAEYHELGLLYISYLMKKKGIATYYLGASVAFKDLKCFVDVKTPNLLYTHITSCHQKFSIQHFLNEVQQLFPQINMIVSGPLINRCCKEKNNKINFLNSLEEVKEFINTL